MSVTNRDVAAWVKALPDELIRARPVLCVGYAWALLNGGELEASEARLRDAERWLDTPTAQMVVVDQNSFARCRLRSPLPAPTAPWRWANSRP